MQTLLSAVIVGLIGVAVPYPAHVAEEAAQGASQISAADAAPFIGEWTLELQGPNGPGTFTLTISAEKEKVTAEITSAAVAKQPIHTISLVEKSRVLGYSFLYEGNPVEAVVSLTPGTEGKTAAQIDFAGGAYIMTGTATKKEKDKGNGTSW